MELLSTKLYMPPLRPDQVVRQRLHRRLDDGVAHGRSLTLVSAPAGYGKTTLVASWLQQPDPAIAADRVAWLSLDEEDSAPQRFFTYLLRALEIRDVVPDQALQQLNRAELPPVERLATALLNGLSGAAQRRSLLVVLDDYHKIQDPFIHQTLQLWIDRAPPTLFLALLTREDPPLSLARWRVRNQLTEIRAADLRFTRSEVGDFLNQAMGLTLSEADIGALERRTEGWIAGLQLAGIALGSPALRQGPAQTAEFIEAFSGSHRFVIDYLVEEVLHQQEPSLRTFLRQTAILDRFCAELCDAVTGRQGSSEVLATLERANLFLVPLDASRRWYRYHHLFADTLRAGLTANAAAPLHRRAAAWHQQRGSAAAAVRHGLASGDLELAADVMEHVIQKASTWSRGNLARLTGWLERLPPPQLHARPALSLHASRALYLAGQLDQAAALLARAEAGLADRPVDARETIELRALADVYGAAIAAMRGDVREALEPPRRVLALLPNVNLHTAARAADTAGLAHELSGDLAAAADAYRQASDLASAAGVNYLAINALCEAAMACVGMGQLAQGESFCRRALEMGGDPLPPPAGLALALLGEIARERNELEGARELLLKGIDLSRKGKIADDLRYSYLYLAHLCRAEGDLDGALAAWRRADLILKGYNVDRLGRLSDAHRARLDLARGDLAQAAAWAERYGAERAAASVAYVRDVEDLALARVLAARGEVDGALSVAGDVARTAEAAGRRRAVMEAHLVRAVALQAGGRRAQAAEALDQALVLAATTGCTRLFLDEGAAVAALLPETAAADSSIGGQLAEALGMTPKATATLARAAAPPPELPEPLTNREEDVLRLLVAGLSNQEIADELTVTLGTAKWHVHNIYQKLDVGSRTEAAARAHEWGLV